jgi:very-short-patch-repair endonuclease
MEPSMTRSTAELLLATQLEQAGIPFEREFRFHPSRKWRADYAIERPNQMLRGIYTILVEIDGGAFVAGRHSRGTGVEADCEKQSAAAILGYRVIRCTPRQVEDGRALSWIKQALGLEEHRAA